MVYWSFGHELEARASRVGCIPVYGDIAALIYYGVTNAPMMDDPVHVNMIMNSEALRKF